MYIITTGLSSPSQSSLHGLVCHDSGGSHPTVAEGQTTHPVTTVLKHHSHGSVHDGNVVISSVGLFVG